MAEIKLTKHEVWEGRYREIPFEIKRRSPSNPDIWPQCWTFYIYLRIDYIPVESNPESYWLNAESSGLPSGRKFFHYSDHPVLAAIDFHGGITFYEKMDGREEGGFRVIKIGCDYQHLWDEGKEYNEEWIVYDVKKAIDSVFELIPNYGTQKEVVKAEESNA